MELTDRTVSRRLLLIFVWPSLSQATFRVEFPHGLNSVESDGRLTYEAVPPGTNALGAMILGSRSEPRRSEDN